LVAVVGLFYLFALLYDHCAKGATKANSTVQKEVAKAASRNQSLSIPRAAISYHTRY
jgi:hypothetical protein